MRIAIDRSEEGAVTVIVALVLTALIGVAVLTVDAGGMLMKRREMVNATDAAALAAAQWCAEIKGALDQSPSAQGHADAAARTNVSDATNNKISFTAACPGPSGEVTVGYTAMQKLYFAPALGFGDERPVTAEATAEWGPAGIAKNVVPVMLGVDQALGECGIPDGVPGTTCAFWYDSDELGSSNWGFLDLSNWDVSPGFNCPNAGAAPRTDWISDGFPDGLALNYPSPTYVCTTSGHAASVWNTLRGQVGKILTFPVNDPTTQLPPASPELKQVDKYNIIGFTGLKLIAIYDGNAEEAIGTSDVTSTCSKPIDFGPTAPFNELSLDLLGCYSVVPQSITNLTLVATIKKNGGGGKSQTVTLQEGVDYTYDAATRNIVWRRSDSVQDVQVSFTWFVSGTSGACEPPERESDPNAKCVIAEWAGFIPTGIEPGGGADLGVRAIQLTD